MDIARAIHARWAADQRLSGLLPAEKLTTGRSPGDGRSAPFATLTVGGGRRLSYANDGSSVDELTVRVRIDHTDYDAGGAIVDALLAVFDRSDFDVSGGRVVAMQRTGLPQESQDPASGRWQWLIEFQCCVQLIPGG